MTAQTSEHGGWIRGQIGQVDASGEALAAGPVRDGLVNNALHGLDQAGQILVNLSALASDDIEGTAATTFSVIKNLDLVVPVRVRHGDGSTFRVVVYMRALASAASTVTFRVALRPVLRRGVPEDPSSFPAPHIAEVSTSSTTGADLAATLYLPASILSAVDLTTFQSTDGGNAVASAEVLMLSLSVWAKSSGAGIPRVYVFTAREHAGDR